MENNPIRAQGCKGQGYTEALLKEELKGDSRLYMDPVPACMCVAALLTENSGRLKGLWDPAQHGWQAEDWTDWRVWREPPAQRAQGRDWTARS